MTSVDGTLLTSSLLSFCAWARFESEDVLTLLRNVTTKHRPIVNGG